MKNGDWIALIIALIAIISLIFQRRSYIRTIRVNKLEELFDLFTRLIEYYNRMFPLVSYLDSYYERSGEIKTVKDYYEIRNKYVDKNFISNVRKDLYRMEVLANSYLKKKQRILLLAYGRMILYLSSYVLSMQEISKRIHWGERFPDYEHVNQFEADVQNMLVNEISIYKKIRIKKFEKELDDYVNSEFKRKLGIK